MTALLRAEWLKQRSIPTGRALALAMLALSLFAVLLHGLSLPAGGIDSHSEQLTNIFAWGELFGALFAALLGAISITGEFRHGTIRSTLLITPRRERVIVAKIVVAMLLGAGFGLVATAIGAAIGTVALDSRSIDVQLRHGDYALLLVGGALAAALWAGIGVGIGAIVRHQVPAIAGLCIWVLFIENLLVAFVPDAGRLGPGAAGGALAGLNPDTLLAPAAGAGLLALYAAVAAAAGWLATTQRDAA
jgi:ABC-type transport system involved in multi-copper enzyme maturation permease subunit